MTDLETRPTDTDHFADPSDVAWAPPAEQKSRKGLKVALWTGIPAALLIGGAAVAGTILIAPGVTVAGVPVGGLTEGAAAERIAEQVSGTTIDVTIGSETVAISGSDLGASVDAEALAEQAHSEFPMWQVGNWFPEPVVATPTFHAADADGFLAAAFPETWTNPVDAALAFDAEANGFVVTPGVDGAGIDPSTIESAFTSALASPEAPSYAGEPVVITPRITTEYATERAAGLNAMLGDAGFYIDEERVVEIAPAQIAEWVTLTPDADAGTIDVAVDAAGIQSVVDSLPGIVNREVINGEVVANSSGTVLRTISDVVDGREVGDTGTLASDYAAQLAEGNSVIQIPVNVIEANPAATVRSIEVNLSTQTLYRKENGTVVDSWSVATGRPGGAETYTGNYAVGWKTPEQTLRAAFRDAGRENETYEVPGVQWVMYFNGDQAFHGVYWQDNHLYGRPGSNGCIGMTNDQAKMLYDWAPEGTEISIHGTTPS